MPEPAAATSDRLPTVEVPEATARLPVPHLLPGPVEDMVGELRRLVDETPEPVRRPRRDDDPPNPRVWGYHKQPVPFRHLAIRFLRSVRPGYPSERATAWARGLLSEAEWSLFTEQPGFDQRHAVGVARVVSEMTDNPLAARAALLHDVGKVDCRLGPLGRSAATLFRMLFPHLSDRWSRDWWSRVCRGEPRSRPRNLEERFASYWMHPWAGRRMLDDVGADPDVGTWALLHHHWYVVEDLPFTWEESLALWYADGD